MSSSHRSPLRPGSIVTAAFVLFLAAAVGSAQILVFQEISRRQRCSSNLRQLGLAVHYYQEANTQLPPLATDENHLTCIALMLPYLDQRSAYDKLDFAEPATSERNRAVVTAFRMPALLCPSRRSKGARKEGEFKGGQPSDYLAVSTTSLKRYGPTDGMIVFRMVPPNKDGGLRALRSRTTFDSVTDGLSNTAMMGEKHMLKDWLDGKYDEPAPVALNDQNTIRIASTVEKEKQDGEEVKKVRGLGTDDDEKDKDDWKFGGPHPTVWQVLSGDVSVRPLKTTTDPKILRLFCSRSDGETFKFPE